MRPDIKKLKTEFSARDYNIINRIALGMTPREVWAEDKISDAINFFAKRRNMGVQGNLVDAIGSSMSIPSAIGTHLSNNYGKYIGGLAATGLLAYAVNKYNKERELEESVKDQINSAGQFSGPNETSDEDREFIRKLMYPTAAVLGTYGALKGYDKYKQYKAKKRLT